MADLLDVNVWVSMSAQDHPHHQRAEEYWNSEADVAIYFCRITALGLVRVTSQRHTFGSDPLSPMEAWVNYRKWRSFPEVKFAQEPPGTEEYLDEWLTKGLATSRNLTDLYLAAFCKAASFRFVTFDRGLEKLGGLNTLVLEG